MHQRPPKIATTASEFRSSTQNPACRKSPFRRAFGAAILLSLAGAGFANDTTWTAGTSTWLTPGNWTDGVPASTSRAIFDITSAATARLDFTNDALSVGAITNDADSTGTLTISTTGTGGALNLYGIVTTIGGEEVTLLIENLSSSDMTFTQASGVVMTLGLQNSGVINTVGRITLANAITGTGGITKIGSGVLRMSNQNGGNTVNSTYSGGFTLKEGTVEFLASGDAALTASVFGTGTLTLEGGALRSSDTTQRNIYNPVVLNGSTVTIGDATNTGAILFSAGASQITTVAADTVLNTLNTTAWGQQITGTGKITKTGTGLLSFNGTTVATSDYSGGFTLSAGTVQWEVDGTISDNGTTDNTTDDFLASSSFGLGTLTLEGGTLRSSDTTARTIYNAVTLNGGTVTFGASSTYTGAITIDPSAGKTTTLAANTALANNVTVNWNQKITGTGSLTKSGSGLLSFDGTNAPTSTYSGGFTLTAGTVQWAVSGTAGVGSPFGLGTVTLQGGTLRSSGTGGRTIYNDVVLNGGTITFGATSTYTGSIGIGQSGANPGAAATVNADTTLNVLATTYWYEPISGTGSITKTGSGLLDINQGATSSTYSGGFILNGGTVQTYGVGTASANPFGTGPLTLKSGTLRPQTVTSTRTIYNSVILDGTVTLGRADATDGYITFTTGTTTVASDSTINIPSLINWNQKIEGPGSITKTGAGLLDHNGAVAATSTFSGGFTMVDGIFEWDNYAGTYTTSAVTASVFGTGTLTLQGGEIRSASSTSRTIYNAVALDGGVAFGEAATYTGTISISAGAGQITSLLKNSTIATNVTVNWNQQITGSGSFTKTGDGLLDLGQTTSTTSTYTGGFVLDGGTVQSWTGTTTTGGVIAASPFGLGTLTLRSGTLTAQGSATGRTFSNAVILDGSVNFGTPDKTAGLVFGSSANNTTSLASDSTLTTYANVTWQQPISGDYGLTKDGPANLTLTAAATYTGPTKVKAGTLYVAGSLSGGAVEVQAGGALGGAGSVFGNISVAPGGTLVPGAAAAPGILTTSGEVSLADGAVLQYDLNGAVIGTGYDSLAVNGAVSLGGAELQLTLGYQPEVGSAFVLIDNFGLGAISGSLSYGGSTLADGALFTVTTGEYSQVFQIDYDWTSPDTTYVGALAVIAVVPEPSAAMLLLAGVAGLAGWRRRAPARP